MSREEWLELGRRLGERTERDRWALGDWACHGDRTYGDLTEAAREISIGYGDLRNLATVARRVELSRRRDNLTWGHHAAVASLPPEIGDELLGRAEAEDWSREVMREEARAVSEVARLKAEVAALKSKFRSSQDESAGAKRRIAGVMRGIVGEFRALARVLEEIADNPVLEELHGNGRAGLARALRRSVESGLADCEQVIASRIRPVLEKIEEAAE